MTYDDYKAMWAKKTAKQVEKELESMRRYVQRHGKAYAWHGNGMTPPGSLADGDKINALREVLEEKTGVKQ